MSASSIHPVEPKNLPRSPVHMKEHSGGGGTVRKKVWCAGMPFRGKATSLTCPVCPLFRTYDLFRSIWMPEKASSSSTNEHSRSCTSLLLALARFHHRLASRSWTKVKLATKSSFIWCVPPRRPCSHPTQCCSLFSQQFGPFYVLHVT